MEYSARKQRIELETLAMDPFSDVEVRYRSNGTESYTSGSLKFLFDAGVTFCIMSKTDDSGVKHVTTAEKIQKEIDSLTAKAREERKLGI